MNYSTITEPCNGRYRAIVKRYGKVEYTCRGKTAMDAYNKAQDWIKQQQDASEHRWADRYKKPEYQ